MLNIIMTITDIPRCVSASLFAEISSVKPEIAKILKKNNNCVTAIKDISTISIIIQALLLTEFNNHFNLSLYVIKSTDN